MEIGYRQPWILGSLERQRSNATHPMFASVRGTNPDFSRLKGAWESISDAQLIAIRDGIPPEWNAGVGVLNASLAWIAEVREHVSQAVQEIERVLV